MNKQNRLTGQILRIAAMAIAISLIFGATSIFYASGEYSGDVSMGDDTVVTTSPSDVTDSSGDDTVSSGDVIVSSGDVTVSPGDVTPVFTSIGTYEYGEDHDWSVIHESMAHAMAYEGSDLELDLGDSVYLYDQNGESLGTLAQAVADGATVEFSASLDGIALEIDEDDLTVYIDSTALADVEGGVDSLLAEVDLSITYDGQTVEDMFYLGVDIGPDRYITGVELAGDSSEITVYVGRTTTAEFDVTYAEGFDLCAWAVATNDSSIASVQPQDVEAPMYTLPVDVTGVKAGTTTIIVRVTDVEDEYPSEVYYVPVKVNVIEPDADDENAKFTALDTDGLYGYVTTDYVDGLEETDSYEVDISDYIYLTDAIDGIICSLAEAIEDGAAVSITNAYATPANGNKMLIPIVAVANSPIFSVTGECLMGGELYDAAAIDFTLTVSYQGETVTSDFTYSVIITDADLDDEEDNDDDNVTSDSDVSGSDVSDSDVSGSDASGGASNTTGNNPDTQDATISPDPSRNTAAVIMLTLGLLIAGALAAERVWRMVQDKNRRAGMIRR